MNRSQEAVEEPHKIIRWSYSRTTAPDNYPAAPIFNRAEDGSLSKTDFWPGWCSSFQVPPHVSPPRLLTLDMIKLIDLECSYLPSSLTKSHQLDRQ